jgi:Zn-dependent protease with chaperone function
MTSVQARFFDGKIAKARMVSIEINAKQLLVLSGADGFSAEWPLSSLRDENAGSSREELIISVDGMDEARLIIDDLDFIGILEKKCPGLRKSRPKITGWWKPYAFWGGGAAVSLVLIVLVVLPILTNQIVWILPDQLRKDIGQQTKSFIVESLAKRQKIDPDMVICSEPDGQRKLERLLQVLNSGYGDKIDKIEVTVVQSPQANAFALPGGQIIVLSGLLDMADDANGFAGVLAHELAHAKFRHPMQLFVMNTGIATVFSLIVGDVTGGVALATLGQMAVSSTYSRELETMADEMAIEIMRSSGFDILPLHDLLQKILKGDTEEESIFAVFDTHPGMEARLALLVSAGNTGGAVMSQDAWETLRQMCK